MRCKKIDWRCGIGRWRRRWIEEESGGVSEREGKGVEGRGWELKGVEGMGGKGRGGEDPKALGSKAPVNDV